MPRDLSTEEQVKDLLNIDTFRNLSKEKVVEFVNTIPFMDRELAIEVIRQFPEYTNTAKLMLSELHGMCSDITSSNQETVSEVVKAHMIVLDGCQKLLDDDTISEEGKLEVSEKMVSIANSLSQLDKTNKEFLQSNWKDFISVLKFFGVGMLLLLGVNVKKAI